MWHPAGGGSGLSGIRELHHDFARLKKETKEAGKELVSSSVIGAPLHTLAQLAGGVDDDDPERSTSFEPGPARQQSADL